MEGYSILFKIVIGIILEKQLVKKATKNLFSSRLKNKYITTTTA